ncbi:MAG: sigma-70 family RNA polymerase sigma factor [Thermodesulfobacteriota bacterium]
MSDGACAGKDFELLRKISGGDEEAFRQLYNQTHKRVYYYLYRLLREKSLAEDVLVETYTEVWRGAKNFKGKSQVTTWMMAISRNLAMNQLKKIKKHEDIDGLPNLSDGLIPDTGHLDRQKLLKEAMLKLSINHREILDLVFFHEMTYQEVSEILDIPLSTVKTRVFYAKKALRGILNQMGVNKVDV